MSTRSLSKNNHKTPRPKRSGKAGLPAGSLLHLGDAAITLIEYDPAKLTETRYDSLQACHNP